MEDSQDEAAEIPRTIRSNSRPFPHPTRSRSPRSNFHSPRHSIPRSLAIFQTPKSADKLRTSSPRIPLETGQVAADAVFIKPALPARLSATRASRGISSGVKEVINPKRTNSETNAHSDTDIYAANQVQGNASSFRVVPQESSSPINTRRLGRTVHSPEILDVPSRTTSSSHDSDGPRNQVSVSPSDIRPPQSAVINKVAVMNRITKRRAARNEVADLEHSPIPERTAAEPIAPQSAASCRETRSAGLDDGKSKKRTRTGAQARAETAPSRPQVQVVIPGRIRSSIERNADQDKNAQFIDDDDVDINNPMSSSDNNESSEADEEAQTRYRQMLVEAKKLTRAALEAQVTAQVTEAYHQRLQTKQYKEMEAATVQHFKDQATRKNAELATPSSEQPPPAWTASAPNASDNVNAADITTTKQNDSDVYATPATGRATGIQRDNSNSSLGSSKLTGKLKAVSWSAKKDMMQRKLPFQRTKGKERALLSPPKVSESKTQTQTTPDRRRRKAQGTSAHANSESSCKVAEMPLPEAGTSSAAMSEELPLPPLTSQGEDERSRRQLSHGFLSRMDSPSRQLLSGTPELEEDDFPVYTQDSNHLPPVRAHNEVSASRTPTITTADLIDHTNQIARSSPPVQTPSTTMRVSSRLESHSLSRHEETTEGLVGGRKSNSATPKNPVNHSSAVGKHQDERTTSSPLSSKREARFSMSPNTTRHLRSQDPVVLMPPSSQIQQGSSQKSSKESAVRSMVIPSSSKAPLDPKPASTPKSQSGTPRAHGETPKTNGNSMPVVRIPAPLRFNPSPSQEQPERTNGVNPDVDVVMDESAGAVVNSQDPTLNVTSRSTTDNSTRSHSPSTNDSQSDVDMPSSPPGVRRKEGLDTPAGDDDSSSDEDEEKLPLVTEPEDVMPHSDGVPAISQEAEKDIDMQNGDASGSEADEQDDVSQDSTEANQVADLESTKEADEVAVSNPDAKADEDAASEFEAEADEIAVSESAMQADGVAAFESDAEADEVATSESDEEAYGHTASESEAKVVTKSAVQDDGVATSESDAESDAAAASESEAEADNTAAPKSVVEADATTTSDSDGESDEDTASESGAETNQLVAPKPKTEVSGDAGGDSDAEADEVAALGSNQESDEDAASDSDVEADGTAALESPATAEEAADLEAAALEVDANADKETVAHDSSSVKASDDEDEAASSVADKENVTHDSSSSGTSEDEDDEANSVTDKSEHANAAQHKSTAPQAEPASQLEPMKLRSGFADSGFAGFYASQPTNVPHWPSSQAMPQGKPPPLGEQSSDDDSGADSDSSSSSSSSSSSAGDDDSDGDKGGEVVAPKPPPSAGKAVAKTHRAMKCRVQPLRLLGTVYNSMADVFRQTSNG